MVSECANPQCATPFRYLTKGSLLAMKSYKRANEAGSKVEWFWLCERCAPWYEIWSLPSGDARCMNRSRLRAVADRTAVSEPAA